MSNCRFAFYKSVVEYECGCDKEDRRVTLDSNDQNK